MSLPLRRAAHGAPLAAALCALALAGCVGVPSLPRSSGPAEPSEARPADLAPYFETIERLAPGDATRQATEFASVQSAVQQSPTAANRLRYSLALGAAGHAVSNPVEARRMIAELLAGPHDLRPIEILLATAFQREFDARVELYAELARQREDAEKKLAAVDAESDRRLAAANGEVQKLRKALAEAERKLEAIAEVERMLAPEGQ